MLAWLGVILILLPFAWHLTGRALYAYLVRTTTVLPYLEHLGGERLDGRFAGNAVVAGGSIAGLITARVLSDHFEEVTVIEPDPVLEGKRTRVPQWNQMHMFLGILRLVICRLFPHADEEAERSGIVVNRATWSSKMERKTIVHHAEHLPVVYYASRMSLEGLVRRLVHKHCTNVRFVRGAVTGLVASSDGSRVNGAQVRSEQDEKTDERMVELAFFVDCTGPASGAVKWLPRANPAWTTVTSEHYNPAVCYATLSVSETPELATLFTMAPPYEMYPFVRRVDVPASHGMLPSAYGISRVDRGQLMVVCFQAGQSDGLPDTTQDFVQFFESVETAASAEAPYPGLADAIQALAATYPDAKFAKYRVANGLYHIRYDAQPSAALPANFAACGDSGLKLNPIFGQGCSKAAMEAACLDAALRGVRTSSGTVPVGFAHQVMKAQVARTRPMFDVARWMDYAHDTMKPAAGESLSTGRWFRAHFRAFVRLAHTDKDAGTTFSGVVHQVEPSAALLKPSFTAKILWNACFA